jgi:hypothetical protein
MHFRKSRPRRAGWTRPLWLGLCSSVLFPSAAGAQAWLTPSGEGTLAIHHQFVRSDVHLNREGDGTRLLGSETFHVVALEGTYGLTDRVAIEGSVVWLATHWSGPIAHRHGPLDTGVYHGAIQDVRFAARYQLTSRSLAVAPFVAVGVPSHSYETTGHSAFGRNLRELALGVSVGRSLRWLPGSGYAHGSVSYSFSQRVTGVDLSLNHANGDLEVGSSIGQRLGVRGFANWQLMRDGLELGDQTEHLHLRPVHDRFARASYLQLGGGATIEVGARATLSVSAFATTSGRNVHAVRAVVTGITWKIGGGFKIRPPAPDPS